MEARSSEKELGTDLQMFSPLDAEVIEQWLAASDGKPRPTSTQRAYRRAMFLWLGFLCSHPEVSPAQRIGAVWQAKPSFVVAWQKELLQGGRHPSTVNQLTSSVSSFYRYAIAAQVAPPGFRENPFHRRVKTMAADAYSSVRVLTLAEYRQVMNWLERASGTVAQVRAHAMIRILLHTGWRISELLAMRAGDLRPARLAPGALRYHCQLSDGREFVDLMPPDCTAVLQAYLQLAARPLDTLEPDAYIWTPIRDVNLSGFGAEQDRDEPICMRTALRVVRTHLRFAGIPNVDSIRLHDLRHTHAYLLHEGGASTETISKRMRFRTTQSTERLVRKVFSAGEVDEQSAYFAKLREPTPKQPRKTAAGEPQA